MTLVENMTFLHKRKDSRAWFFYISTGQYAPEDYTSQMFYLCFVLVLFIKHLNFDFKNIISKVILFLNIENLLKKLMFR